MKNPIKKRRKRKASETVVEESQPGLPLPARMSDDPPSKKPKWINRQRALVFSARGITQRDRHLIKDLKSLMPHSKDENKMEKREHISVINEMCIMKNCNKAMFFESRKKKDLYAWISNVPDGPSAKFLVENVHTMGELKLTGNCLKGSRPILSFDENFKKYPHYALLKELFIQVFGVSKSHPKSQPFFDKVYTFTVLDNRIWFRNYQILKEDGALAEIGPRFILNPIKIFEGSFGGVTLWDNQHYVTPSAHRRSLKASAGSKYVHRKVQQEGYEERRPETSYPADPVGELFGRNAYELAAEKVGVELPQELKEKKPISFKVKKRGGKKKKPPAVAS